MSKFNLITAAVTATRAPWAALAENGAIVPGVNGHFVLGTPTGQLDTVATKGWPKAADRWEPVANGATFYTAVGRVTLPVAPAMHFNLALGQQARITQRTSDVASLNVVTLDGREFAGILASVVTCAAGADKAAIDSVFIRTTGNGYSVIVTTDGYKLIERRMVATVATVDVMINAVDAKVLASLIAADGYPVVKVAMNEGRITVTAGDVSYFAPDVTYGTYPSYDQLIPTTFEGLRIVVNVKELLAAVKSASLKDSRMCALMNLEATPGYGIKFSSVAGDSAASAHCSAEVSEDWMVSIQPEYLTQVVKALDCESVVIYPNATSKLGVIVIKPLMGASRAVLMPLNK
jgi:DNA polymerase III sliding clamp (beta) subunit (PCNA family)